MCIIDILFYADERSKHQLKKLKITNEHELGKYNCLLLRRIIIK